MRKLLSTIPEAATTVENLVDGIDVPISITREEFEALTGGLISRFRALVDATLEALPAPLAGVEAFGGGTRMPCVQAALAEALAANEASEGVAAQKPGAKLDDTSIAIGAALIGKAILTAAAPSAMDTSADGAATDGAATDGAAMADGVASSAVAVEPIRESLLGANLQASVAREAALAAKDADAAALSAKRNEFEGYVLESRGLRSRKHGELIDGSALEPLLDNAEEWLYSEEADESSLEGWETKLAELRAHVGAATAKFDAAVASQREQEEAAMEVASAQAAAEKAANGEEEDHDTRKMKFPERLRLVSKNKEEGTELLKGGNYRMAAARYNKALTHAAKFLDLSPDQKEEVESTKLSLHLNIAMCWLKITDAENHLDQCIRSCTDALAIDEKSLKALFRRATAREAKGDYEGATADLKMFASIDPEDAGESLAAPFLYNCHTRVSHPRVTPACHTRMSHPHLSSECVYISLT